MRLYYFTDATPQLRWAIGIFFACVILAYIIRKLGRGA